jgi:general L-amino acid transport system permease protein
MSSTAARVVPNISQRPMFRGRSNVLVSALLGGLLAYVGYRFLSWAVVNAIWRLPQGADSAVCRAAKGEGACWAVIGERFRFILAGTFPLDQQWRPGVACLLFVLLYIISAIRACWKPWLLGLWFAMPTLAIVLLHGGFLSLPAVSTDFWGGLPLTFVLATVGFVAASPLAVALALGRRSQMPVIRWLSIGYIELVRGVPLITFLFMAAVMFPLFMPQSFVIDKLVRAQIALVMVIAAYLAEVIRGGIQAIPQGQHEAATSMGLSFWPATILVVLPQALRLTIPAIVNTFIGFFKDTSLVTVVGLFDLLGTAKAVIVDPKWSGFGAEVYLFVATIYFVFGYAVSHYSQHLEKVLMGRTGRAIQQST